MRHLVAPFFHRALFVLLAILPGAASAQTAVPRWEDLYRPASPPPIAYSAGIASREIADGSILVVTDQFICIRFDHDGNTLSAIPLPISTRVVPNEGADSKRPRSGDAPSSLSPLPPGASYADIDPVGRVAVAYAVNLGSFFPYLTGDMATNVFDGLTGLGLWPKPQIYGAFGAEYPVGVHFDRDGNVITIGGASGGGTTSRTIKYDGRSGEILWGPQIFYGNLGAADVNFSGDALLSFAQPDGIATCDISGPPEGRSEAHSRCLSRTARTRPSTWRAPATSLSRASPAFRRNGSWAPSIRASRTSSGDPSTSTCLRGIPTPSPPVSRRMRTATSS